MTKTIPLAVSEDLDDAIRATAKKTRLPMSEVWRQCAWIAMPILIEKLAPEARITNVDPLSESVLKRIYRKPEEENEAGVSRFMKAQAFGGED